jgi:putative DNA methylase
MLKGVYYTTYSGGKTQLKRTIESTFPTIKVNIIAEKESTGFGRRHYRPVYVMHKWWARRLGSVFRTILLYSLADDRLDEWNGKQDSLWELYSRDVDLNGKIVLDPMMGGGTTVIEALKLGCKVVAGDLNPVAWFLVKKQVEDIDPSLIVSTLQRLDSELGPELRQYYTTTCPECKGTAEAIYYFYYKVSSCSKCANEIPLMRNFFLAKSPSGSRDFVVCPKCWNIFKTKNAKKESKCTECGEKFIPTRVSYSKGRRSVCSNPDCGQEERIVDVTRRFGKLGERMYAIEFYCEFCDNSKNKNLANGRGYKVPDERDRGILERANKEYQNIAKTLPIPDTLIPLGVETRRALNHGYRKFSDMFNHRQLLNLGKIYRWILGIEDWNLKEFFLLAFSNSLKYNNMFAKYNATRGFITDIFRTHSFSPSMAPVEANCYDTAKGRGAFTAFVNLVVEGKEYSRRPFERIHDGKSMKKVILESKKPLKMTENFQELTNDADVMLRCGSSEHIDVPDRVVDAVVTDPPYYGNVMYSELSNFFYVWLRIGLNERYDIFKDKLVPTEGEVIENKQQGKGREEFIQGLTKVFTESHRVLSDDGILVFTFHHKKQEAWGAILRAVLESGFYVTTTYPVRSEMKASTHLHDLENIVYDMIFVCRKRGGKTTPKSWNSIMSSIERSVKRTIERLQNNGETPSSVDTFAIVLGKCLELYSKHYPKVMDGNQIVSPEKALGSIEELLGGL